MDRKLFFLLPLLVPVSAYLFFGCSRQAILIGYAAELTGIQSEIGVQGRNGAALAVEDINSRGGIAGRRLELLVRDDGTTPEEAVNTTAELVEAGALAIIGHVTSTKTMASLPYLDRLGIPMVTPTASSPRLEGASPLLFRMNSSIDEGAVIIAQYLFEQSLSTTMVPLIDEDNLALSIPFTEAFAERFRSLGGIVEEPIAFSSRTRPPWERLAGQVFDYRPEGVLIIANAVDTAAFASALQNRYTGGKALERPQLISTGWAYNTSVLHLGGGAVEGMLFIDSFSESVSEDPAWIAFSNRYHTRFGAPASFAAAQGYNAVLFLARGLEANRGKKSGLPEKLRDIREFEGVWQKISMSRTGEAIRPFYLSVIKNGTFVLIDEFLP
jgi:branched-chain amino acid transport system substrate-binding protein